MQYMSHFENLTDDGLTTPEVGGWGLEKYRLISHYASIFVKSMTGKWDCLVYLDLYSGAGRARIKENGAIIQSSPLLVLGQEDGFDQYIFNDASRENCEALGVRIGKEFPTSKVNVFCEDASAGIEIILGAMPKAHKGFRVLSFCFLDPFKMDNLKFSTLERLSKLFMDFLVLIPSGMDAERNEQNYLNLDNKTVDRFLGNPSWRDAWYSRENPHMNFGQFIVKEFGESMGRLGFIVPKLEDTVGIKNSKNRVIYRLALYSKHKLGEKFWKECAKYTNPQTDFGF